MFTGHPYAITDNYGTAHFYEKFFFRPANTMWYCMIPLTSSSVMVLDLTPDTTRGCSQMLSNGTATTTMQITCLLEIIQARPFIGQTFNCTQLYWMPSHYLFETSMGRLPSTIPGTSRHWSRALCDMEPNQLNLVICEIPAPSTKKGLMWAKLDQTPFQSMI